MNKRFKNLIKSRRKADALTAAQDPVPGLGSKPEPTISQHEEASGQIEDGASERQNSSIQSIPDRLKATNTEETLPFERDATAEDNENQDDGVGLQSTANLDTGEEDIHPNPRVRAARKHLFDASRDLLRILQLYREARKDGKPEVVFLADDAKLSNSDVPMTPEQLTAAVESLLLKQQNQKPSIASKVGSAIGKLYPLASLTLGLGATVAESTSFTPVKGAVNGLCLLLSIADQEQARSADFLKQLDRISYQALRVAEVQKHSFIEIGDLLLEKSVNLMTIILQFFKEAIVFFRHDYLYNVTKTIILGSKIYSDAKLALDTAIVEYDQALLLEVTIAIINKGTGPSLTQVLDQPKKSELISWLKSSYWEVESEFSKNCNDRAAGTLQWVLDAEEFKNWRLSDKNSQSSRALWLNGLPGVGKSTIAAYITQVLQTQHPDAAVLYFFCKAGDPSLENLIQLVRTLASQLALTVPSAQGKLQMLKDDNFKASESVSYMLQQLVKGSIADLHQDVFIIIDGLDECDISTRNERGGQNPINTLLEGLLNSDVKLLVSSRPTPEISRAMSSAKKRELTYEDSRGDIEHYVAMRVSRSKILENGFNSLRQNPPEFIAQKSQGNFLWVKIILNILEDKSSLKGFQEAVETIPKDLESVYDQVLTKIDSAGSLEMASAILKCVLFSIRPLTLDEVKAILCLLQDEILDLEEFVESNCGSFLRIIPGKESGLYIVHETFRSYITNPTSSKEKYLLPPASHAQFASACLGCLLESDNAKLDALRQYATEEWLQHLGEFLYDSKSAPESDVLPLMLKVHAFFTSKYTLRRWMREFSLLPSEYYTAMRIANMHDVILEFLQSDAIKQVEESMRDKMADQKEVRKALMWRASVISGNDFASEVYLHFANVWISANWQELDIAERMLQEVIKLKMILWPRDASIQRAPLANYEKDRIAGKRRGWKFDYDSAMNYQNINIEELNSLASSVGFNPNIGVQGGNFAFGELLAGADNCIKSFKNAIDENPDCWHLHEGLAEYYRKQGKIEIAISCLAEAMQVDTKKPPSAAYDHWTLIAKMREKNGDVDGAIEALKEGATQASDENVYRYWDAMAQMYENLGDGNAMVGIYEEAIKKHPAISTHFRKKLGETLRRGGARQQQFDAYRDAIEKDPETVDEYGKELRNMADELKDLCVWQPVDLILSWGIKEDPHNASQYHQELGRAYMCQRKWKEAAEQLETYARITEDDWAYEDIGNAYLGLGETDKAIAAYQVAIKNETDYGALSRTVAYAHILDGKYTLAIRIFKSALSAIAEHGDEEITFGFMQKVDDAKPRRLFELYRNLGLCYEAQDRLEEMQECFQKAVEGYKPIVMQLDRNKERDIIYRHEARALFELGLIQEKLGLNDESKASLSRAVLLFDKTTLEGDDEVQESEETEAKAALARLSSAEKDQQPIPDLKEKIGEMRLQRRLALKYTTDWYVYQDWEPPRRRGAREWNMVSRTNKFKITNGDRTFIAPLGPGHHH